MSHNLPYLTSQKRLKLCFEKIKETNTPEKLDMKGGGARTLPPYLKRVGFIASDSSPTDFYKEFRNPALSGQVAFKALKHAYSALLSR